MTARGMRQRRLAIGVFTLGPLHGFPQAGVALEARVEGKVLPEGLVQVAVGLGLARIRQPHRRTQAGEFFVAEQRAPMLAQTTVEAVRAHQVEALLIGSEHAQLW